MSNRTWACIDCGKTYRRDQNYTGNVLCAICRKECEYVHWKIHLPSPKKKKEWSAFWEIYLLEKNKLDKWNIDGSIEVIKLDLLNMTLHPKRKT